MMRVFERLVPLDGWLAGFEESSKEEVPICPGTLKKVV